MSGRALITGLKDNGKFGIAAMTQENHLEVAIHSPRLPFGSIHTERMTPIFQSDAVYGLNSGQVNYGSTLSGATVADDSLFSLSTGSTTNLTVKCASFAGFIEGEKFTHGNRFTYTNTLTNVGATNFHALFTFRNLLYYGNRVNQAVVNLLSITAAIKHTSPVIIYLIKNATLLGNPNFVDYSSTSCTKWDTAATTCTYSDNNQVIWSGSLGDTGNLSFEFVDEITLQPGESLTVAAKSTTGTPSYVVAAINTREDQ